MCVCVCVCVCSKRKTITLAFEMKHVAINFASQLSTMFFDEATHALKKKLETPPPTRGWQHGANTWLGRLRWRTGVLSEKFLQLLGLLAIGLVLWLPVTQRRRQADGRWG